MPRRRSPAAIALQRRLLARGFTEHPSAGFPAPAEGDPGALDLDDTHLREQEAPAPRPSPHRHPE